MPLFWLKLCLQKQLLQCRHSPAQTDLSCLHTQQRCPVFRSALLLVAASSGVGCAVSMTWGCQITCKDHAATSFDCSSQLLVGCAAFVVTATLLQAFLMSVQAHEVSVYGAIHRCL